MQIPDSGAALRFALLFGAAIISTIVFIRTRQPDTAPTRPQLSLAYYLDSAELVGTDANGERLYRVWTDRAAQVSTDDSISMKTVRMVYTPNGPQSWNLAADSGRIPADASIIELNGNVIVKSGASNAAATTIKTNQLDVDPATQEARTPEPVIVDYNGHIVNAIGLYADFKNNRLKLLSDVTGNFTP